MIEIEPRDPAARACLQRYYEERARRFEGGLAVLRLDANRALPEAATFYRRHGWREIARFNDDLYAHLFFEKRLAC
jgi:hypothetical protein